MDTINTANIPDELKQHKSWVLWKYIIRGGNKTKVLYQTCGAEAKSNDPSTWDTFSKVMERHAAGNWEGIGFVFSPDDPYTGIDLDGCRNPETKVIEPWAKEIIANFGTYAELSPSLSGVKMWVRGSWPVGAGHNVKLLDMPKISEKTPGVEAYDWGRFFTVTGKVIQGFREIRDNQPAIDAFREQYFKPAYTPPASTDFKSEASVLDRARKYVAKMPAAISGAGGSDAAFRVACVLVLGFALPIEDALGVMEEWNATCLPPWSERELRHKLDGADSRSGDRGYLRNVSPDNYRHIEIPNYVQPKPAATEKPAAPEIRATTMRDASKKYLEQVTSNKVHLFELGLPDLDYSIGGGVEAGEMIIFAARPSHGKSMAAQQVTHNVTARGIPVLFVSEEMSAVALGKRVLQYVSDVPNEHWKTQSHAVDSHIDKHFKDRADCFIIEGCRTAERVATEIRRYVAEKKIGLAIVDYAQLLTGAGKGRYEQITNVSTTLKQVAAECGIPVIVLCQMSRAIERRDTFAPVMSDLKESGQFEQDADVIIFQVWPFRLDPENNKPEEYQLFVCKNRNRPINQPAIKCHFNPGRQKLTYEGGAPSGQPEFSEDVMSAFDGIDGEFR